MERKDDHETGQCPSDDNYLWSLLTLSENPPTPPGEHARGDKAERMSHCDWDEASSYEKPAGSNNDCQHPCPRKPPVNPTHYYELLDHISRPLVSQDALETATPSLIACVPNWDIANVVTIPRRRAPLSLSVEMIAEIPHAATSGNSLVDAMLNTPPGWMNSMGARVGRFLCEWRSCEYPGSFGREAELIRHIKEIHLARGAFRCPVYGCGKTCNRRSNLQVHMRRRHSGA